MSLSVGIDLGTTNSVISYMRDGKINTILIDGKNTFPSNISIRNKKMILGHPAKSRFIIDPRNSIGSTKRSIGTHTVYNIGEMVMTPTDVAFNILKVMKEKAEGTLGESIVDAVVTVPAYFTSRQREETKRAAEMAGFNVLRLMPEPTAAAISYGFGSNKNGTIMVYDLGGGTFDVSVLKICNNDFKVLAVDGDSNLGGDDFDWAIVSQIYKKIFEDTGRDIENSREEQYLTIKQKVKESSEKLKIDLSDKESSEINMPNLFEGYDLEFEITLSKYKELVKPLLDRTIEKIKNVLNEAKISKEDIDKVILVGGSTKSPIIKNMLKNEISDPFAASNVDEVVSNGAAIVAAALSGNYTQDISLTIQEITSHSYGIDMVDESDNLVFQPIIRKGTAIPFKAGQMCYTCVPNQEQIDMCVYMGESAKLEKDEKIGEISLKINNPKEKIIPAGAIFEMDENMILHFTSVELEGVNIQTFDSFDVEEIEELIRAGKLHSESIDLSIS